MKTEIVKETTETKYIEGADKKKQFIYTVDFQDYLTLSNIKLYLSFIKKLEKDTDMSPIMQNEIFIDKIGEKKDHAGKPMTYYFKINHDNSSFFIKHSIAPPNLLGIGGYKEGISTKEAENILLENKIDWARIIPFKLGYSDKNDKYYISERKDISNLQPIDEYLDGFIPDTQTSVYNSSKKNTEENTRTEIYKKFNILKILFRNFFDFAPGHNVLVDTNTKELYLFDLTKRDLKKSPS
ncbi:MAG: hypothetical protein NTX91_00975 [candidate division SR1 bacterium]|nr:hypothetical protein [candidate division SR1 bacterium]